MEIALVGSVVDGRFRIDAEIGAGGFATVYRGVHLAMDVPIAFKVLRLPPERTHEERAHALSEFVEEARVLTRIRHEHVVRTYDQGILRRPEGDAPYLVTEWCELGSLRDWLQQRGCALSLAEAWAVFAPVVSALAAVHAQNVVHRDLKPANVMLTREASGALVPRVIDFGIAKLCDPNERAGTGATITRSGKSPFTPAYASPEQLAGARTGPWTDVHALGLLFTELVIGRLPYEEGDLLRSVLGPSRPTPGRFGVDVGPFEPVIAAALALRPMDRPGDASALGRALDEAAGRLGLVGRASGMRALLPAISASPPSPGPPQSLGPQRPSQAQRAASPRDVNTGSALRTDRTGVVTIPPAPSAVPYASSSGIVPPVPASPAPARSRRAWLLGAAGVAAGAAALGGAWALGARSAREAREVGSAGPDPKPAGPKIPLTELTDADIEEVLVAQGAAIRRIPVATTGTVYFEADRSAGMIQVAKFEGLDALDAARRRAWAETMGRTWRETYGLPLTVLNTKIHELRVAWREGEGGAALIDALAARVEHEELRRELGHVTGPWPRPATPPNRTAMLSMLSAIELVDRLTEADFRVTATRLGAPLHLELEVDGTPAQLVHFGPLLSWCLSGPASISEQVAALRAAHTPCLYAMTRSDGLIVTGQDVVGLRDRLAGALSGLNVRVDSEPLVRRAGP